MAFYKKLSCTVYDTPNISDKNMASFTYNTDDFPPLLSNGASCQLTSIYIPVKTREQNSKVVSFSKTVNPLLFEKNVFVCTSKHICFLLNQMIFSGLILGLLLCHANLLFVQHLVHRMLDFLQFLLLLYVTVKTSVIVLYVVIPSVRVVVMLIELVHLIVLQISVSLLNSLPVIHS